jgi:hypothetical protein
VSHRPAAFPGIADNEGRKAHPCENVRWTERLRRGQTDPEACPGTGISACQSISADLIRAGRGTDTTNWLRVSMGVGGNCYSGVEMIRKRRQNRFIS